MAFRQALADAGYIDRQNVAIEFRYAEGQYDRLPKLAAELTRRQVAVIVAAPNVNAARAAKAVAGAIPVVFLVSDDPAKLGLVASLNRPGGNATGVNFVISELVGKRLGLLRELLPALSLWCANKSECCGHRRVLKRFERSGFHAQGPFGYCSCPRQP